MIVTNTIRVAVASLFVSAVTLAGPVDEDRDSLTGHAEVERFLQESKILDPREEPSGEEKSYIATATDGQLTHTVFVQTVEPYKYQWFESRADHRYNAAAHKLDRAALLRGVIERNPAAQ